MVAQYVVAAPKVENINFGWFSSGKLVAPKEDNIQHKAEWLCMGFREIKKAD